MDSVDRIHSDVQKCTIVKTCNHANSLNKITIDIDFELCYNVITMKPYLTPYKFFKLTKIKLAQKKHQAKLKQTEPGRVKPCKLNQKRGDPK